jgi:hypothetical protein
LRKMLELGRYESLPAGKASSRVHPITHPFRFPSLIYGRGKRRVGGKMAILCRNRFVEIVEKKENHL